MLNICDYLLYLLNRSACFTYVDFLNLRGPTDDVRQLLSEAAKSLDISRLATDARTGVWDLMNHTSLFQQAFFHQAR